MARRKKKNRGAAPPAPGGAEGAGASLRLDLAPSGRPAMLALGGYFEPGFVAAAGPLLAFVSRLARVLDPAFVEPRKLRSEEHEEVPYDYERRTYVLGDEGRGLRVVGYVGCDAGSGFTDRRVLTVAAYGLAEGRRLEFEHHDFVPPFGSAPPAHYVEVRVGGPREAAEEIFRAFRREFAAAPPGREGNPHPPGSGDGGAVETFPRRRPF